MLNSSTTKVQEKLLLAGFIQHFKPPEIKGQKGQKSYAKYDRHREKIKFSSPVIATSIRLMAASIATIEINDIPDAVF